MYNVALILETLANNGDILAVTGYASELSLAKAFSKFCPEKPQGTGLLKYLKQVAAANSKDAPEELKHTVYKSEYVYAHKQKDGTIIYLEPQADNLSPMEYAERLDFYTQHNA